MRSETEVRGEWLARLLSTAAADRPAAEAAVRRLYAAVGFAAPQHMLWFDSPSAASWPVALLAAPYDFTRGQRLSSGLSRDDRTRMEKARATLGVHLGIGEWDDVLAAIGAPRAMSLAYPPDPSRILSTPLNMARLEMVDDMASLWTVRGDGDPLHYAEDHYWGGNRGALGSELHCPTAGGVLGNSFYTEYSFSTMADDEHRLSDREVPAAVRAAWDVAQAAGLWWPFENAVVFTDRPAELHVNERNLLHREDGPALVYRDGWRVYAWNGKAVPERWITQPESVPAREYKGFDPTFAKFMATRAGQSRPTGPSKRRAKPGSILEAALPTDPAARLDRLRSYAGGKLPFFDRYLAGEHRQVWEELVTLGAGVREDPHAADALAVAYETMRHVDANVRTLVQRLQTMKYVFTTDLGSSGSPTVQMGADRIALDDFVRNAGSMPQLGGLLGRMAKAVEMLAGAAKGSAKSGRAAVTPHVPPGAGVRKEIAAFEKEVGALPLSLRAFYEVVGEVNLIGHHPSLAPRDGQIAPDPLVVYGFDEGAVEYDEDDDDGETPSAITIAPDDLHKADTSGGDPYEMAIPDPRADGELLNERHNLFFVDYLRLCFSFGGFPGYDGVDRVPDEIATLSAGLVEF